MDDARAHAAALVDLFQTLHPLDRVPRAGFLLRGVAEPESVAAHMHFAALLALLFSERYPDRYDQKRLLAMALIHDISEARIMDIPMPYADAYMSDAKHRAEQSIIEDLLEDTAPRLADLHAEFAGAESPEARLLRGLDKAQMMIKVWCYEQEHRGDMREFWANPKNFNDFGIAEVSEIFEEICQRAGHPRPSAV